MPSKSNKKTTAKKTAPAPKDRKRLHIIYKGRVQGVGFRYTAERIALEIGVTGWVRNLPDGDVELTAEGAEQALTQLVDAIQSSLLGKHIKKTNLDWQEHRGEFTDFRVEFCY